MGIRISEMEEATNLGEDDVFPIVKNGSNKKSAISKIKDFISGFFVSKSGDTMTGDLTVNNASDASFYLSKSENVTLNTTANNNVTTQQVRGMRCQDKNDQRFGAVQSLAKTDGSTQLQLIARNMRTNGSYIENHIYATMNKDASMSYEVSSPSAFRDAIGTAPSLIDIGNTSTSPITINTTSPTIIKTITQSLKKGDYIAFYTIKATWTNDANQFRPVLKIGNDSYQGVYSYAAPQTNESCTYLQKITVPNDGSYTFGLAGVVSNTSKIVTIPAYQTIAVLLLPI